MFSGVPEQLPALLKAMRISSKAARVGFDWPDRSSLLEKLEEEKRELLHALRNGAKEGIQEEIGDLLFAAVNLSRFVKADPEARLRLATEKFRRRFDRVAAMLRAEGRSPAEAGLPELDRLWEAAKREERAGGGR